MCAPYAPKLAQMPREQYYRPIIVMGIGGVDKSCSRNHQAIGVSGR